MENTISQVIAEVYQYDSDTSVTIGWGLHGVIDNIPAFVPDQARKNLDANYPDIALKQGAARYLLTITWQQEPFPSS